MKWKYYPLADDDPKAKKQVLENVSMGASEHTFTKKLLARFSETTGTMLLIAFDTLDLDADWLYEYGTYDGGKPLNEAAGTQDLPQMECPIGGLILFIKDYLQTSKDAVVFCDKWSETRTRVAEGPPRESRILFYGEEVYHVLTSKDTNADAIECAIRESTSHWATGVCSLCVEVPQGDIPSEAFLDAIVANTAYIFTPALDGEGYLVWSPSQVGQAVPDTTGR